jgi:parallel beta-helix repeat protein
MQALRRLALALALAGAASTAWAASADDVCQPPVVPAAALRAEAYGAKGDGVSDDTLALQAAIAATPEGGTLVVGAGNYPVRVGQAMTLGLRLKSRMTLLLEPGATLQALPTADGNHALLRLRGVTDVLVYGGQLLGERDVHLGRDGEWGMGIEVYDSERIRIGSVQARGFWGDGFYFGGQSNRDVRVCGVVADGNRRNGMSIVSASGMTVTRSAFVNTRGTAPQAGVDIEPNKGGLTENVTVSASLLRFNRGNGLSITMECDNCATNRNNRIQGNVLADNGGEGLYVSHEGHVIVGNVIENSGSHGMRLWNSRGTVVTDNVVRGSRAAGLQLESASGSDIRRNQLQDNRQPWRLRWDSVDNAIEDNRCAGKAEVVPADAQALRNRYARNPDCPER